MRRAAGAWLVLAALLLSVACGPEPRPNATSGGTYPPGETGAASRQAAAAGKANWVRFGFDPARSGVNPEETLISPRTVGSLHVLWRAKLPGVADSSPILLHDLEYPKGSRDVLYATTRDGTIVALDAARSSGATGPPAHT